MNLADLRNKNLADLKNKNLADLKNKNLADLRNTGLADLRNMNTDPPPTAVLLVFSIVPSLAQWPRRSRRTLYPAYTTRRINVGLRLVHRLRRWTNVKPTLIQRLISAG